MKFKYIIAFLFLLPLSALAQAVQIGGDSLIIDYATPKDYVLAKPTVVGDMQTDPNVIRLISGLTEGDRVAVPGDKFSKALESLWKQGLFDDVKIIAKKVEGEILFVEIVVVERPRLITYRILGVSKSQSDDLRDKLKIGGKILTDYVIISSIETIKQFFIEKGYYDVKVDTVKSLHTQGSVTNGVKLDFVVKKGERVKISDVVIYGNNSLSTDKLRRAMKDTRQGGWYNFWFSKKFIDSKYEADKPKILQKYYARGFRDAQIVKDTVTRVGKKQVKVAITINEGHKYYFRNISWVGNSKYTSKTLTQILGIKKGDVYNQAELDSKLNMSQTSLDISSLYMDDGYLFFHVEPIESLVENDSIDLEMHIYEGKQAIINKVTVVGNTKTNDRVIMREIRTKPGQLFRRSDIIRTQRELSQLGYFNAEKMGVNPVPHPETGTVDIEYTVEEKPSDQLELSAGFGANRVVGTLGFSFTNFSTHNVFKKDAWRPLPSGDGQRLSIRAQSSGLNYQGANFSFTEPWLGGKKPLSFSISGYLSHQSNRIYKTDPTYKTSSNYWDLKIKGASLGLGRRLKWPDDYFNLYQELNFQHYTLNNYPSGIFPTGQINNFNYKITVSRNSVDRPIFETRGSNITFSAQLSPPYSAFNDKDYSTLSNQEKYQFLEFQKYKFTSAFYTSLIDKTAKDGTKSSKLVLYTKAGVGFLGNYNAETGIPPFERFYLGGSGLSGINPIQANEIIALRGYTDKVVYSGSDASSKNHSAYLNGSAAICKFTAELRVPISLNPSATVYALAFAEAGNSWASFKEFNPFQLKRSVGVGVRLFLPMFGLLGFDYGWGLDPIPGSPSVGRNPITGQFQGQFHFIIGGFIGEL